MERFYDERINMAKGRAMRKTVWFVWLFTLLYTAAVIVSDVVFERFRVYEILVQILTLIGGGILILWGELAYLGAKKDERKAALKTGWYVRAFYALVYLFAFAYCIHIAVNLRFYGLSEGLPLSFFPSLLLECGGLVLIYSLKKERVMLNYSAIEERMGRRYYQKVLINILIFGGISLLFTILALYLFLMLGGDVFTLVGLGVIFGGLLTWLTLSFEYFLLSVMERLSEQAMQRGRLSLTTVAVFLASALQALLMTVVTALLLSDMDGITATKATLYQYVMLILGRGFSCTLTFFFLYFAQEVASLDTCVRGRGLTIAHLKIAFLSCESIAMILKPLVGAAIFSDDTLLLRLSLYRWASCLVGIAISLLTLLLLWRVVRVLADGKQISYTAAAILIVYTAFSAFMALLSAATQNNLFSLIGHAATTLVYVFFSVYVIRWYRKIRFESI